MSPSKQIVLITGATGLLGFRTLVLLLQAGYRVRITYRRPHQVDQIRTAKSVQPYLDDIDFANVADFSADGAFDEATEGVAYVLHVASPTYDPGNNTGEVVSTMASPVGCRRSLNDMR